MAKLVKCKDCGHEISKQAKKCPQCGKPQKRTSGCAWIALVLCGLVLFAFIKGMSETSVTPPPQQTSPRQAQQQAAFQKAAVYVAEPLQEKLQGVKAIAKDGRYGWFVKPCTETLCGEPEGYLVAFRAQTDVGMILPVWKVSHPIDTKSWVNGKAKEFTPDLPQANVPDIAAIANQFKNLPDTAAVQIQE